MNTAHLASGVIWGLGDWGSANILLARVNRMVCIPSLSHIQLEILRLAKESSGRTIRLSYEIAIIDKGDPPTGYPAFIQGLIDIELIEVKFKKLRFGTSQFQKDSWKKYSSNLELPSIYAWELWRDKYIARQKGSQYILIPGEGFEHFSYVWIEEIGIRAIQPSEDAILL